jgi:hypothetical protein
MCDTGDTPGTLLGTTVGLRSQLGRNPGRNWRRSGYERPESWVPETRTMVTVLLPGGGRLSTNEPSRFSRENARVGRWGRWLMS